MVIVVGGASHTGKTLVAQKLVEKYHYSCTSLDHLKMGFIRTKRTELSVDQDWEMRDFLWPFAAEMIKTVIENKQDMILEGCYVPEKWKESFTADYTKEIRTVFLVMSEKYLRSHEKELQKYNCVIEHRIADEIHLDSLIEWNRQLKKECISNGTPYIEIDDEYQLERIIAAVVKIVES